MKICINCGAEYDDAFEKCPYCGMADREMAEEKHRGKVKQLKQQRQEIKKLPDLIPKKSTRYVVIAGGILLALFLLILMLVFVGKKIMLNVEAERQQKNIEIMEGYLEAGDYAGLDEFCREVPHVYAVYDKYREVTDFYFLYDNVYFDLDMVYKYGGKVDKESVLEDIADAMYDLRKLCIRADEACNDRSLMGNEQHIEELKDMGITVFKEYFQADETVVARVISEPETEGNEMPMLYIELAEQFYDNLEKVNFGRTE